MSVDYRKKFRINVSFDATVENIRQFSGVGRKIVEGIWPDNEQLAFEVEMCLVEALSNVFFHAHNRDCNRKLCFQMRNLGDVLDIRIYDQGRGFRIEEALHLVDRDPYLDHGRGLKIIFGLMDEIEYVRGKKRNYLLLRKKITEPVSEPAR